MSMNGYKSDTKTTAFGGYKCIFESANSQIHNPQKDENSPHMILHTQCSRRGKANLWQSKQRVVASGTMGTRDWLRSIRKDLLGMVRVFYILMRFVIQGNMLYVRNH